MSITIPSPKGLATIDAKINGILKADAPEILVDKSDTLHNLEIALLHGIGQQALRGVFDRAFEQLLVPHYYADKAESFFFVDRNEAGYKGGGVVLPLEFWYLDVFGTDPLYQGNGTARAVMRKILEGAESLALRSREDRPINDRFYKPLINQLVRMGIPAEFGVLPEPIHGHNYIWYGINMDAGRKEKSRYLAQNKAPNFG